jgi:hypothetical protein
MRLLGLNCFEEFCSAGILNVVPNSFML